MADTLQFDFVAPEKLLRSGPVARVDVPGAEGRFGVLAKHSPCMALLRAGLVVVAENNGAQARYFIRGGIGDVTPEGLTLLVENALALDGASAADIDAEIAAAQAAEDADALATLQNLRAEM